MRPANRAPDALPPPRSTREGEPRLIADEACLEAFQRELDYLCRTLRHLGVAPPDVEDLIQEVFLALRRSWPQYDVQRPLRPYLFAIAFRVVGSFRRKRKREVPFEVLEPREMGPDPHYSLQSKQARALVLAALEDIPLRRRAVLVMHDLHDVPVAEVAAALELPLFTVYSRLRKARSELGIAIRRKMTAADVA